MNDTSNSRPTITLVATKSLKETLQLTFGGAAGGFFYAMFSQPGSVLPVDGWEVALAIILSLAVLFGFNLILNMVVGAS